MSDNQTALVNPAEILAKSIVRPALQYPPIQTTGSENE
jgi:hypothetical protein